MASVGLTELLTNRINRINVSATMAVVAEANKLKGMGTDLVDFGAGEPHFPAPQHIKDAAIDAIQMNCGRYTAVAGIPELRSAIVKRHAADFGTDYKQEESIASTGGKLVIFNVIQTLVQSGDEVILPVPYWTSFKDIVEYAGGKCIFVDTDESRGFQLTADMIERQVTSRTRAIIINSPNNPSGAILNPDEFAAIIKMAFQRGIYVISDECYIYLDYTGHGFSAGSVTEARERIIIVGSLSKTYAMTGWRVGFALAPAPIITALTKLQSQHTSSTAHMIQKAAVAALSGPQFCIDQMRGEYIQLRNHMLSELSTIPRITWVRPDGAFYVYPNVSSYFGHGVDSAADVSKRLLHEAGVVTVPGEAFGTRDHIRLSYATSSSEISRGIARMRDWFHNLPH